MEVGNSQEVGINLEAPCRKSSITARDLDEETMLYDPETKQVHILNKTALLVWQLCDGRHSVKDMAAAITRACSQSLGERDEKSIEQDVISIIDDFAAQRMVG